MADKTERKRRRILKMKTTLVDAAKVLFRSKGYKDTTVDEIVDKALISKATFYQYFKSKEELFLQTIQLSKNQLISLLEENVIKKDFPKMKKLKLMFFYLSVYSGKDHYMIHLLFYRESSFNEEITSFIKEFTDEVSQKIESILSEFSISENSGKKLSYSIMGAVYFHVLKWYVGGKQESLKEVAKVLYYHFSPYLVKKKEKVIKKESDFEKGGDNISPTR